MTTAERIKRMMVATIILQELEEEEQNAFMCASVEMLAKTREMSPFDLMKQYIEAIIEVNLLNEDKRK